MTIKKQQLKEIIKQIVRESLSEHEYKMMLNEVSPPGEKAERMIKHVKASLRDTHPNWSDEKITGVAIATAWKSHNKGKVEEGMENPFSNAPEPEKKPTSNIPKGALAKLNPKIADGGPKPPIKMGAAPEPPVKRIKENRNNNVKATAQAYKTVADRQYEIQDDAKARNLPVDPKITEVKAEECGTTCSKKKAMAQKFRKKLEEAGFVLTPKKVQENGPQYKVESPRQARVAADDHAREVQEDPKLTETAYKTQGPALRTFKDSPQFPKAQNDPKVA